ncbi:MAG: ABC transporter ATP-binding protein/permease [Spirochaetaceae bacterium]|nr:ABC transporter ATP-binding protein/permease [Spirochaetaceae bacterium]
MAEYFETDDVTRGYDSNIARRILSYIKPYKALAVFTMLALILSTLGELLSPVIIRQAIDDVLMKSWYGIDISVKGSEADKVIKLQDSDPVIQGKAYVRTSRLGGLSTVEKNDLTARKLFDPTEYYLFRIDEGNAAQSALRAERPELFASEGQWACIARDKLRALPAAEAAGLRRADSLDLGRYVIALLVVMVFILIGTFFMNYFSNLVSVKVMKDLRMQLFGHVLTRSMAFISHQPVGRLVTRMTSDVETISEFFTDVLSAFIKDGSIMVGSLIVLYMFDVRLALVVTASIPFVLFASNIARKRSRDAYRKQRQWTSKVNAYIAEHISGIEVVKLFSKEEASKKEFAEHDANLKQANLGEMYVYATFRPIVDLLSTITTVIALCVGAWFYLSHSISLGTLIAFVNLIGMFYSPIKDVAEKYVNLQSAMAGAERIFGLLDAKEEIIDAPKMPMPSVVRGHIQFEKVWFAYKEEDWVLKDVSFTVEPGQMVAIVGYTGAGKTTITNLVTRFWDIQKGSIRIDGNEIRDLPLDGLRRSIQPVPQDVFLFAGTIADNIRLGTEVSEERMRIAAEAVHANEFIEALPKGYGSELAEGGSNLSQGQRQLISFARVLAHDPSIIILDEATSSVDTETEKLIQRGIEGLLSGRTSIVIAHRLSTIRNADKIIVLAHGKIVESGTHDELISRQGLYWNLYRLQNSGIVS